MFENKEYLDRKECARYLEFLGMNITAKTLANIANLGEGPSYTRVRWKRVYYRRVDVEAWVKSQTQQVHRQ